MRDGPAPRDCVCLHPCLLDKPACARARWKDGGPVRGRGWRRGGPLYFKKKRIPFPPPKQTALFLLLAASSAAAASGLADDGSDVALASAFKEEAAADAAALAAALAQKLEQKAGADAPGYVPGTTIPLTLLSAANGSSTLKCGRGRQCIDHSGPLTFGVLAEVSPTLALGSTPWTDTSTLQLLLSDIPYVVGAQTFGSVFSITTVGKDRLLAGNGLPPTPIGNFPVASGTDAYPYYATLPGGTDPSTGQPYQPNGTSDEIPVKAYNLTSTLPRWPVKTGAYPVNALIVGVAVTGVAFHAEIAPGADGAWYSPTNVLPLDVCWGHPYANQYHLHGYSWKCLPDGPVEKHSPLVGYGLDGFGIYGPRDVGGKIVTNDQLDKCHGHVGPVEWEGKVRRLREKHARVRWAGGF